MGFGPHPDPSTGHWDAAYADGDDDVSWDQRVPALSLELIGALEPDPTAPVVDVGGGSSRLAGFLLDEGRTDVTVLDLSPVALDLARDRLGQRGSEVTWVAADLRSWRPARRFAVWHDRAVLHFLVDEGDRRRYRDTLLHALAGGGHAIIGTFAPDGPERCSGLPVVRSSPEDIEGLLGPEFTRVRAEREEHVTPSGRRQAFNWLAAQRSR